MLTCRVCGKENPEHVFYCEEHYHCADCGTREGLRSYEKKEGVLCDKCKKKRLKKRIAEFDGDTDHEYEITCPWCGYVHHDSWEYSDSDDDFECSDCENKFVMVREIEITYSTSQPNS